MSKMDNLRAMREARYEAAAARAKQATSKPPAKAAPAKAAPTKAVATPATPATTAAACGHRNMSGRTCTRPQGHAEKSHRYS